MATLTVYANDNANGFFLISEDANYENARNGLNIIYIGTDHAIGQLRLSSSYRCYISYLKYDTSVMPTGSSIISVTESLYLMSDSTQNSNFTDEVRLYNWGDTLDAADWLTPTQLNECALLSSRIVSPITGYNEYPTSTNFISAINIAGKTQIIHNSNRLRLGNTPPYGYGYEYLIYYSAKKSGTTQDPKLTITYEEGGVTPVNAIADGVKAIITTESLSPQIIETSNIVLDAQIVDNTILLSWH